MNNISFQSRIKFVSPSKFNQAVTGLSKDCLVDYPWTAKESVLAKNAYTKNIFDCTVCGITDGLKVLLMHICPTRTENDNFFKIINFIKNKATIYHFTLCNSLTLSVKSHLSYLTII